MVRYSHAATRTRSQSTWRRRAERVSLAFGASWFLTFAGALLIVAPSAADTVGPLPGPALAGLLLATGLLPPALVFAAARTAAWAFSSLRSFGNGSRPLHIDEKSPG